jgi:BlaI family penicillinase repressor
MKPTESELEILTILWEKGSSSVGDVHQYVSKTKNVGYTTTLKLMQIMHEKKMVTRDESSKKHIYTPTISKNETQHLFVDKMIDNLFGGSTVSLVLQALGQNKTSKDDLLAIEKLIQDLKKID